jgi:hypothetical protein
VNAQDAHVAIAGPLQEERDERVAGGEIAVPERPDGGHREQPGIDPPPDRSAARGGAAVDVIGEAIAPRVLESFAREIAHSQNVVERDRRQVAAPEQRHGDRSRTSRAVVEHALTT